VVLEHQVILAQVVPLVLVAQVQMEFIMDLFIKEIKNGNC
jgi:hypothetical protein